MDIRRWRGRLAFHLLSLVLAACTSATPSLEPLSTAPAASLPPGASATAAPGSGEHVPTGPGGPPGPIDSTPAPPPSPPPSEPAGAADQIVAAMEAGEIDYPTSLLYRMYAVMGDPR